VDALRLDGNAAAGVLQELFTFEVTTMVGTCDHCGTTDPLGAVHLYRAAGLVLRCRGCDEVLLRVVESDQRMWIDLRGLRTLEVRL
jgi:hypothetical protein